MFASVLVPLDGSRFAEAALPTALELVRRSQGALHVVRVGQMSVLLPADTPTAIIMDSRWIESIRAEEAAHLTDIGNRIAEETGAGCVTRLLEGMPAEAIDEYARAEHVELIVMATHGRGGLSRFWLGSVADSLVRQGSTPVLLIRPLEDESAGAVAVAASNILVPLDGSELSLGILPVAVSFARAMSAGITLLRVVPTMAGTGVFGLVPLPEMAAEAVARANAELGELASKLRAQGIAATPVVVQSLAVAPAILEYAKESGVDAIAIATHGRGGFGRVALGSVADKVLRGAAVPVLSFRPQATHSRPAHVAA